MPQTCALAPVLAVSSSWLVWSRSRQETPPRGTFVVSIYHGVSRLESPNAHSQHHVARTVVASVCLLVVVVAAAAVVFVRPF